MMPMGYTVQNFPWVFDAVNKRGYMRGPKLIVPLLEEEFKVLEEYWSSLRGVKGTTHWRAGERAGKLFIYWGGAGNFPKCKSVFIEIDPLRVLVTED